MAIPFVESVMRKRSRVVQAYIKVLEVMLLSTGLISTLFMLKEALFMPYPCQHVFSSLLGFWNSVRCFLSSPLFICIIINFMVLFIKLSSTFHHRIRVVPNNRDHLANIQTRIIPSPQSPPQSLSPSPRMAVIYPNDISTIKDLQETSHADSPMMLHRNTKQDSLEKPNEELIPQTISQLNRKPILQKPLMETKNYPSKRGLSVEVKNDNEGDSMEATWKAIMGGGKQRPKKRPLKKSETWDVPPKPRTVPMERLDSEVVVPSSPIWREMRNAESFNDAMSITRRGGLIRRDSSMSLEDFNNKVEGFIKKLKWKAKASRSK